MGIRAVDNNLINYLINSIEKIIFPKNHWKIFNKKQEENYLVTNSENRETIKPMKFNKYFCNFLSYDSFLLKNSRELDSIKQLGRLSQKLGISRYEKAIILGRLASRYSNLNMFKKAEKAYIKQLELYTALSESSSDSLYSSDIAMVLFNLAFLYDATNQKKKAEINYDKALTLYAELVEKEPSRYGIDYANTIIFAHYNSGKYKDSLNNTKRVLETYSGHPRAEKLLQFLEELDSLTIKSTKASSSLKQFATM